MSFKYSTCNRVKASHLPNIISASCPIRDRVHMAVKIYILALMIKGYKKTLTNIAITFGLSVCSLSRAISHHLLGAELDIFINRQSRKIIATYINRHGMCNDICIIIDSTTINRSGKNPENVGLYHSNGNKVWGHRVTNILLLLDGKYSVPLVCMPHYTRKTSRNLGIPYRTEGMMVRQWLRSYMPGLMGFLREQEILVQPDDITFLLDAGYDNAEIQRLIRNYGCHFVMMIKNTRKIQNLQVKLFFKKMRCLGWENVYLKRQVNKKTKRRKFRIAAAQRVYLSGVGYVNAVCSEKQCGGCSSKENRRYIISSRLSQDGRHILDQYSKRWKIETWHKEMKQNYGLEDCSASSFDAIENHIKLCLIAYFMHLSEAKNMPKKGVTIVDYLQYQVRSTSRRTLTLINGRKKMRQEIGLYSDVIFAKTGSG